MSALDHRPVRGRAERGRRRGSAHALMQRKVLDGLIPGQGGSRVVRCFAIGRHFPADADGGAVRTSRQAGSPRAAAAS